MHAFYEQDPCIQPLHGIEQPFWWGLRACPHKIETLIGGGNIETAVHEDITYDSVYDSADNLWNFLFLPDI